MRKMSHTALSCRRDIAKYEFENIRIISTTLHLFCASSSDNQKSFRSKWQFNVISFYCLKTFSNLDSFLYDTKPNKFVGNSEYMPIKVWSMFVLICKTVLNNHHWRIDIDIAIIILNWFLITKREKINFHISLKMSVMLYHIAKNWWSKVQI